VHAGNWKEIVAEGSVSVYYSASRESLLIHKMIQGVVAQYYEYLPGTGTHKRIGRIESRKHQTWTSPKVESDH
jgi:hypothetical protein